VKLLLDTGILGQICHPRRHADVREWFRRAVQEHGLNRPPAYPNLDWLGLLAFAIRDAPLARDPPLRLLARRDRLKDCER
jgi:hypothetical protein